MRSGRHGPHAWPYRCGDALFRLYLRLDLLELVLHLHQPLLTQLDELPRLADLHERGLEVDLVLLLKPIRDLLDVLQVFLEA